jgi:hypothetical protein
MVPNAFETWFGVECVEQVWPSKARVAEDVPGQQGVSPGDMVWGSIVYGRCGYDRIIADQRS